MQSIVEVSGLSVAYGETLALRDVSLTVNELDFIALIGPNGGGKTTLLKALLGLAPIRSGEIRLFGKPPREGRIYAGYCPQRLVYDPAFPVSVREVVRMGRLSPRKLWRRYSREDEAAVDRALDTVEIAALANRGLDELSGGQVQRVFIARALVSEPRLLVLDEPAAHLDPRISGSLFELLRRLNESLTILITTHDVGAISSYIKTVGCVNQTLHYHGDKQLTAEMIHDAYHDHGPVDVIVHDVRSRTLK